DLARRCFAQNEADASEAIESTIAASPDHDSNRAESINRDGRERGSKRAAAAPRRKTIGPTESSSNGRPEPSQQSRSRQDCRTDSWLARVSEAVKTRDR